MIQTKEITGRIPDFTLDESKPEDNNDCFVNHHNQQKDMKDGDFVPSIHLEDQDENKDLKGVLKMQLQGEKQKMSLMVKLIRILLT